MQEAKTHNVPSRRRLQFSLRLLLILTALAAVATVVVMDQVHRAELRARPARFRQAVLSGDIKELDRLLAMDPQLAHGREHYGSSSSITPLQLALSSSSPEVIDRILKERPNLDEASHNGETVLHMAIRYQRLPVVIQLVDLGANVNAVDREGNSPIHVAAQEDRNGQMITAIIAGDGNLELRRRDGKTPLRLAVERRNQPAIAEFLKAGVQVNDADVQGHTALHIAIDRSDLEIAKLLLQNGANLVAKDHDGNIPGGLSNGGDSDTAVAIWWEQIVKAHDQGSLAKLTGLFDVSPQALSFRTKYGTSLLTRTIEARRLDVLGYLLERRAKANIQDDLLADALVESYWCKVEFAEHLLNAGADIRSRDRFGRTVLHGAATAHNHDLLRLLIARGADLSAIDNAGTTVLDASFERNFFQHDGPKTLEILKQAGHPPTVLNAAALGDLELLRKLSEDKLENLDREYTNSGVRPLHAAVFGKQAEVIRWLVDHKVDLNPFKHAHSVIGEIDSPLMVAMSYDLTDVSIMLINLGVDTNCVSFSGYYPVLAAIAWDRNPIVLETLLAHGADPALKYRDQTALDLATKSKSKHRARYLELLDANTKVSNR